MINIFIFNKYIIHMNDKIKSLVFTKSNNYHSNNSKCILMIGVRGSGKSYLVPKLSNFINIKLNDFGVIDGDIIRSYFHNNSMVYDKLIIENIKNELLQYGLETKRNIIILDSGEKAEYYYEILKQNKYKITIIGVYVDNWEEIQYRGEIRSKNGRPYTGTKEMWENSMNIIKILIDKNKSEDIVIDNTDYNNPKIIDT